MLKRPVFCKLHIMEYYIPGGVDGCVAVPIKKVSEIFDDFTHLFYSLWNTALRPSKVQTCPKIFFAMSNASL